VHSGPVKQKFRKLRVLEMCTDFGTGGISRHAIDLQKWLNARGHSVALGGTPGEWAGPDTDDNFLDIPVRYVASEGGNVLARLTYLLRCALKMRRWLARNPTDIIHVHETAPALVARLATLGRRLPMIITYHGSDPDRLKSFGATARRADLVITPSHRSGDDLVTLGGVARDKLNVIGLGIKPAPPVDPDQVAALRTELLGDGTRLIVTLARIAHQKGIDILIDCVAQMKMTRPDFRFVIVGEGPLEADMKARATQKNLLSHLTFAGRSEQPFTYLHAGDLMLLTSRWEALPISIVESFQAATPVVATDCSGVAELVDDTVGACVAKGDTDAICAAVQRVLDDRDGHKALSRSALERSREPRFDPDVVNARFEAIYQQLIGA